MALTKSRSEYQADAVERAIRRGRASRREASIILGIAYNTVDQRIGRGQYKAVTYGGVQFLTLEELARIGAALPLPILTRIKSGLHFSQIDSNHDAHAGAYDD